MAPDLQYTVGQFTPDELRLRAENDPSVIVMQHAWDRTYEPYEAERVAHLVNMLADITRGAATEEEARALATENDELRVFGERYGLLYRKMTTPAFVADPRAVQAVLSLVDLRQRVERGQLSARSGEEHAAGIAIRKALLDAQPSTARTGDGTTVEEL